MPQIRHEKANLNLHNIRLIHSIVEDITARGCIKAEFIVLRIFEDQNFFNFVDFDDAIDLFLAVIAVCIEVGTEDYVVEENIYPDVLLSLQLSLALKERLEERPEDKLIDYTVENACLLLVLEEWHLAYIHS
jgi:hypothetical protein